MFTEKCNTIHLEHLRWGKKLYPGPGANWHRPGWTTMGLGSWLTLNDRNFTPDILPPEHGGIKDTPPPNSAFDPIYSTTRARKFLGRIEKSDFMTDDFLVIPQHEGYLLKVLMFWFAPLSKPVTLSFFKERCK